MDNKKTKYTIQESDINQWIDINMDNLIQDTVALVNIPSVSIKTEDPNMPFGDGCRAVLEEALSMGRRMGFEVMNHENYCGSLLWRGESEKEVGIFGHLDVVPEGTGWIYRPYDAVVEDGIIVGRGAADNKGSALSAIYGVKYLMNSGYKPRHSIRIFLGCNEEAGMEDIQYYIQHHSMPEFSFTPDASFPVCYGEKGIMEIDAKIDLDSEVLVDFGAGIASNAVSGDAYAVLRVDAERLTQRIAGMDVSGISDCGNGCVKIVVTGVATHAAFPEGSDSAEVKLASILLKSGVLDPKAINVMKGIITLFSDYYGAGIGVPYEDEVSGKLTHIGGVAKMEGGKLHQNLNIRYTITAERQEMKNVIVKTLNERGFIVTRIKDSAPNYVDQSKPIIQELTNICNKHLGMQLTPYVMGGGTYARKLKHAVGYGPGVPGNNKRFGIKRGGAHQPDEYVEIQHLKKAVAIYAEAIVAIDTTI